MVNWRRCLFLHRMIFLDNNSTTSLAPEVSEAIERFENSLAAGPDIDVNGLIDEARESVANLLGADSLSQICLMPGGTQSVRSALLKASRRKGFEQVITTAVEHNAVTSVCRTLEQQGFKITYLGVDGNGLLDLEVLRRALTSRTAVVSVMHANHETGVIFPVEEIAAVVKENSGAFFHVDGAMTAGKVPLDLKNTSIDLYSISAHKFNGPGGIGALYLRDPEKASSLFDNEFLQSAKPSSIVGLTAAADISRNLSSWKEISKLRDRLEFEILSKIPDSRLNGTADPTRRLPNTSNISFENTNGESIAAMLAEKNIWVSTGSACASFDHASSPTLKAMNVPYSYAMGSIRFSLSRYSTEAEVDAVIDVLPGIVARLRSTCNA